MATAYTEQVALSDQDIELAVHSTLIHRQRYVELKCMKISIPLPEIIAFPRMNATTLLIYIIFSSFSDFFSCETNLFRFKSFNDLET